MVTSRALHVALVLSIVACGGARPTPTVIELANAAEVAPSSLPAAAPMPPRGPAVERLVRDLAGVELWAVVEVSMLKDNPLGGRIEQAMPYSQSLSKSGIVARADFDRIFLADESLSHHHDAMTIYEHHIDAARVDKFMDAAVEESWPHGHRTAIGDHPCAILHRHGLTGTACVGSATLLIVAVEPSPSMLKALETSSGIGHPPPGEAIHATFLHPYRSMELGSFHPPTSLGTLEIGLKAAAGGGFDLTGRAPSSDAVGDAGLLDQMLRAQASSMRYGPLSLGPPPIQLTAEGEDVVARLAVDKDELEAVMTLVELFDPL